MKWRCRAKGHSLSWPFVTFLACFLGKQSTCVPHHFCVLSRVLHSPSTTKFIPATLGRWAKIPPSPPKVEFLPVLWKSLNSSSPEPTNPSHPGSIAPAPHRQEHPSTPVATKASELLIRTAFKMTLFSGPCAQKNYQFLIPFMISVTVASSHSWDTTQQCGVLRCQWQTQHFEHLFNAYFSLWKRRPHIYLSKNQMNHSPQQQKSRDTIPSSN